jgi:hypothetical protein
MPRWLFINDPAKLAVYGHEAQVLVLIVGGTTLANCVHPLSFQCIVGYCIVACACTGTFGTHCTIGNVYKMRDLVYILYLILFYILCIQVSHELRSLLRESALVYFRDYFSFCDAVFPPHKISRGKGKVHPIRGHKGPQVQ